MKLLELAPHLTQSESTTAPAAHPVSTASSSGPVLSAKKQQGSWDQVVSNLVNHYVKNTPQRTKLIDAFMAFLVAVGALQFLYCVLAGNYVRLLLHVTYTLRRRRTRWTTAEINALWIKMESGHALPGAAW